MLTRRWTLLLLTCGRGIHASDPPTIGDFSSPVAADAHGVGSSPFSQAISEMRGHSTIAGTVIPVARKLYISRQELISIWKGVSEVVHLEDVALFAVIGFLSVPAIRYPFKHLPIEIQSSLKSYYRALQSILEQVQQLAKIALVVYVVDVLKIICIGMGFRFFKMEQFPHAFAQIAYTIWAATRLREMKRHYFRGIVDQHPDLYGRMQIIDRLSTAALGGIAIFIVLSILQVKMGVAMASVFAVSGAGTLAFGLASQGITKQVLNGLMLASSDRIYEGDEVRFGNGKAGTIVRLGWMETELRGSDDIRISIPNTDLVNQAVSNLSRVRYSQVKQTLRFKYGDRRLVPIVLKSIKEEVRAACPELVTDGTRPFRAHWTDYQAGFLEATVDFHFRIRPVGEQYWDNRQKVLQAIDRAIDKHEIELKM